MCNHELKRLFYTKDADYNIQTCRVDSENGKNKYTLCYCKKCGQVFVMEIAKTYTEPDRKAVDLQYARDIENVARMNYNEGTKDAWDFAKAINYMGYDDFVSCFGGKTEEAVYELSYSEVKAEYEAWKESKEEIHVGDEIRIKTSYSADAVVIGMDDYDLFIVWKDGETDRIEPPERKQWVKTGRHFKEVEELLKKITEESNED